MDSVDLVDLVLVCLLVSPHIYHIYQNFASVPGPDGLGKWLCARPFATKSVCWQGGAGLTAEGHPVSPQLL